MIQYPRNLVRSVCILVAVVALVASACGPESATEQESTEQEGSAESYRDLVHRKIQYDFNWLESPADAIQKTDLVVSGTVRAVDRGMEVWLRNPFRVCADNSEQDGTDPIECNLEDYIIFGSYLSIDIEVDKVISGSAQSTVTVQIEVPPEDVERGIAAVPIGKKALLILSDETGWKPSGSAEIRWPGDNAEKRVWFPRPDGLFIEGVDNRAISIYADEQEVANLWGLNSVNFRDFENALINAAK